VATLSYGGASFTFPNLTAPPLGLDTSDATKGRAAETVAFTGLLRKAETDTIWNLCRAWRAARLPEEPAIRTGSLGATIAVTASGPGFTWTSRPCWITDGPSQDAAGSLIRVSLTLVDAAQALAIQQREIEEGLEEEEALGLGTLTFGSATVNLTAVPGTFDNLPQADLTPAGAHVITGPLVAIETRDVQGWVTAANKTALETWFTSTIASTPAAASWWPTSPPRFEAFLRTNAGALTVAYRVQFGAVKIR
jgi:hypothetical protein